jgi:mRNA interferase HigB
VHVISRPILAKFWTKHADARDELRDWYNTACGAQWKNLTEIQAARSKSVEAVSNFTVFNIGGNKYRLIVDIIYKRQTIFIKYILTHAEYDKENWKKDPYF